MDKGSAMMEKKRVLFTATVVKQHIMTFHIPYLRMFQEMGWETAVAAANDYEDPRELNIPNCDAYYEIPFERIPWKAGNLRAYRQLKKLIDEGNFDIIHCHTPVGGLLTRLAARSARKRGTKVMYTAHGFHFHKGSSLVSWLAYYPVEWLMAPLTDLLLTMNREDYALARKRMHARRVEYVPGVGIDTTRFASHRDDRQEKRKELGFRESDFLILTVAEMNKNKNQSMVLKALARLKDTPEFVNMKYLICGMGEYESVLRQEAEDLGIADHVFFMGYRKDIPAIHRCCDLFAFMSYREGLPVALMEAMSSGMPTVCSAARGNTDLVAHGVEGWIVDNEPQALADAILEMYRNPELRQQFGHAATEKVKQFDCKNVHRIMKDLYLGV